MSPSQACGVATGGRGHQDSRVLIAVHPPSLERLLEHLLAGQPELRVVGGSARSAHRPPGSPAAKAARLAPDLIIANTRLLGREPGDVVADLKRSSPASTLILLTHGLAEPAPHPEADACLPEEAVVRRLLPTIREALDRPQERAKRPALAGRRA